MPLYSAELKQQIARLDRRLRVLESVLAADEATSKGFVGRFTSTSLIPEASQKLEGSYLVLKLDGQDSQVQFCVQSSTGSWSWAAAVP